MGLTPVPSDPLFPLSLSSNASSDSVVPAASMPVAPFTAVYPIEVNYQQGLLQHLWGITATRADEDYTYWNALMGYKDGLACMQNQGFSSDQIASSIATNFNSLTNEARNRLLGGLSQEEREQLSNLSSSYIDRLETDSHMFHVFKKVGENLKREFTLAFEANSQSALPIAALIGTMGIILHTMKAKKEEQAKALKDSSSAETVQSRQDKKVPGGSYVSDTKSVSDTDSDIDELEEIDKNDFDFEQEEIARQLSLFENEISIWEEAANLVGKEVPDELTCKLGELKAGLEDIRKELGQVDQQVDQYDSDEAAMTALEGKLEKLKEEFEAIQKGIKPTDKGDRNIGDTAQGNPADEVGKPLGSSQVGDADGLVAGDSVRVGTSRSVFHTVDIQAIKDDLESGIKLGDPLQVQFTQIFKNIKKHGDEKIDWASLGVESEPIGDLQPQPNGGFKQNCKYTISVECEGEIIEFEIKRDIYVSQTTQKKALEVIKGYNNAVTELAFKNFVRLDKADAGSIAKSLDDAQRPESLEGIDDAQYDTLMKQSYFVLNRDENNKLTIGTGNPKDNISFHLNYDVISGYRERYLKRLENKARLKLFKGSPEAESIDAERDKILDEVLEGFPDLDTPQAETVPPSAATAAPNIELPPEAAAAQMRPVVVSGAPVPTPEFINKINDLASERVSEKDAGNIDVYIEKSLEKLREFEFSVDIIVMPDENLRYLENYLLEQKLAVQNHLETLRKNPKEEPYKELLDELGEYRQIVLDVLNPHVIERLNDKFDELRNNFNDSDKSADRAIEYKKGLNKLSKEVVGEIKSPNDRDEVDKSALRLSIAKGIVEANDIIMKDKGLIQDDSAPNTLPIGYENYLKSLGNQRPTFDIMGPMQLDTYQMLLGLTSLEESFQRLKVWEPHDLVQDVKFENIDAELQEMLPAAKGERCIVFPMMVDADPEHPGDQPRHIVGLIVDLQNKKILFLDSYPNHLRSKAFEKKVGELVQLCNSTYGLRDKSGFKGVWENKTIQTTENDCGPYIVGMVRRYLERNEQSEIDPVRERLEIQKKLIDKNVEREQKAAAS